MKKIKPKYRSALSYSDWVKSTRDNGARKYHPMRDVLEDVVRDKIRKDRDMWRTPYYIDYIDEHQWELPEAERKEMRFYYEPGDKCTIREMLAMDDAKFHNTSYAKRFQRIRVPSLKRTNKEWENFYRTFPWLGAEVAVGNERFCDGAKLKYIPLFKKILDEEWPEDLKPWTEKEYDKLIAEGKITQN
jgi:hypothetical protein